MILDPKASSTTLTDGELRDMSANKRADAAHAYDWVRNHGFSGTYAAVFLAQETLNLRQLVRAFIQCDPTSKLAQEAERFLGFNLTDPPTYMGGTK